VTGDAERLRLDLNNPVFQEEWLTLPKQEQLQVLSALRKLAAMTWTRVYQDAGLKWELIHSRTGPQGARLYSLRMGKGFRALAYREGNWLRLLSLHPDHDSAYRR
jgi:hypothetical protein